MKISQPRTTTSNRTFILWIEVNSFFRLQDIHEVKSHLKSMKNGFLFLVQSNFVELQFQTKDSKKFEFLKVFIKIHKNNLQSTNRSSKKLSLSYFSDFGQ